MEEEGPESLWWRSSGISHTPNLPCGVQAEDPQARPPRLNQRRRAAAQPHIVDGHIAFRTLA